MTPDATDLFYAIHNCRAMRRLKPDPVPENLLMKLISAANQGPTGSNKQNARWIVVRDPAQKKKSPTSTERQSTATSATPTPLHRVCGASSGQ